MPAVACSARSVRGLFPFAAGCLALAACDLPPPADLGDGADIGEMPPQPNIVLILADDLGIGDVGAYGGELIATPNIDALAAAGVRATQGYVSHPTCSPSRAGMVTGRSQLRHGWEFNPAGRDLEAGLATDERTFARALKERGYRTGLVGKWHLGYGHTAPHHPLNRGFDEYFGVLAGGSIHIHPNAPGVESLMTVARRGSDDAGDAPARPRRATYPSERNERIGVYRGFDLVEVEEYLTDAFTDEAIAFINRHQEDYEDKPFFLFLSHLTPHTPLQATEQYLAPYRHIEDDATRIYAAMVGGLDESVARVVAGLKSLGLYENTVIAFLSDNGCAGYIGVCSNGPLAGFKRYHHEGGIRVPFIVSWPEGLPAGQDYDEPVSALDLLATFTGAAGSELATEDSVNLIPYFTGERPGRPHDHLYWRAGPTIAIRDERHKLIRYARTDLTPADLDETGRLPPPEGGWPAEAPLGHVTLLYDLREDPGETTNLAAAHPEIVERLLERYGRWSARLPDRPPILPAWRSTLAEFDGETVQLFF